MVQAKKRTKQQKRERRAHISLSRNTLAVCPKCGSPVRQHRVCTNCGYYKGRDVMQLELRAERKKNRDKKKEKRQTQ